MEHPLRTFRRANKITLEQLGARVGATKGFLSKIESKRQLPSMALAAKISEATNGAVTPNDLISPPAADQSAHIVSAIQSEGADA
ncbi:hypothetical protein A1351_20265 [Methylosinus sp. R-45379]|uniref:helix-turn-helix domain-containing protein n=1 Tax=Methylosinus sp. R-45379 TaxID=980563 RepID=UPI0007D8172E|nr:helix-turn-helix transcriptional regulator [Methylosinus sp. R-45379]OAI22905.1 hypothetical protein A1351_20265 [Methylosinus sp. R-45379]